MTLTVESLGKSFGDEETLAGVDLSVADGEICVVVGPSGCGKTTLLHCVSGLVRPDDGDVRRNGESLLGVPVSERGFGVVFQDFEERLFPHKTVAENVAFGLRQTGDHEPAEIEARVGDVLDRLAISATRDDYPPTLSGGQQPRVELARQLVRDTDFLLLDDPLSDLDYKLQKRLELELRRLHADAENTVLYVTHNQDQALRLADRMVVMNRGMVEQVGSPHEIYAAPSTAFVARFVGDSNLLVAGEARRDGAEVVAETPEGPIRAREGGEYGGEGDAAEDGGVVIVRPEHVRFWDGANAVEGVLEQRNYTGESTEFVVSLAGAGGEFRVQRPGSVPLAETGAAIGDEVTVSWDPGHAHYFGREALSVTGRTTVDDLAEV